MPSLFFRLSAFGLLIILSAGCGKTTTESTQPKLETPCDFLEAFEQAGDEMLAIASESSWPDLPEDQQKRFEELVETVFELDERAHQKFSLAELEACPSFEEIADKFEAAGLDELIDTYQGYSRSDLLNAQNGARQIYLAMVIYDSEYGYWPTEKVEVMQDLGPLLEAVDLRDFDQHSKHLLLTQFSPDDPDNTIALISDNIPGSPVDPENQLPSDHFVVSFKDMSTRIYPLSEYEEVMEDLSLPTFFE
ncbi:MAG: hypothetical protein JJT75_14220 [Opitutales bacterium]|nr:hypothetical protein [Opitutales bacterium]MCH8541573.1 hypothetical protein [Opitutales bacterium]